MIKIGIVGCGRILPAHMLAFRMLRELGVDGFRIAALCARRAEDAEMFVQRGQGPPQRRAVSTIPGDPLAIDDQYLSDFQDGPVSIHTDYRDMIASADINAVHDYSTHGLHHLVAEQAFAHGHHLLTQKPLAVTMKWANRMIEQAEAAGRVFGVCENWRYRPDIRRLKWLLESGRLGDVQMMLMGNIACWWAPNQVVAETPWRHDAKVGGGISLDMGVHQFHFVRHLVGEVAELQATTAVVEPQRHIFDADGTIRETIDCDADDTYFATFRTADNVVGTVSASWAGHGGGTVIGGGPVVYGTKGRVAGNEVTLDGNDTAQLDVLYDQAASEEQKQRDFPLGLTDTLALIQYDWLQAIEEGRQPETSGHQGRLDLACAFAILESAKLGKTVQISDVLNGTLASYQDRINLHLEDSA